MWYTVAALDRAAGPGQINEEVYWKQARFSCFIPGRNMLRIFDRYLLKEVILGWLAVTIVLGLAGARLLITGGRSAITGGILLLIGALAAEAVAFGGRAWGPAVEGSLDLSSRLGLGVLGGILAGLFHALLTLFAGWTGIAALLGSGIEVQLVAADWIVGIGGIYPNNTAGFGGGSKLALGVLSRESIKHLHGKHLLYASDARTRTCPGNF